MALRRLKNYPFDEGIQNGTVNMRLWKFRDAMSLKFSLFHYYDIELEIMNYL